MNPRTLLLMRHAKSSWTHAVDDHDRPLNKRGLRDAPTMANRLADLDLVPDLVLASTAVRARTTAEMVHEAIAAEASLTLDSSLYLPSVDDITEALACLAGESRCVLLVAHNPGVTSAVHAFSRAHEEMPTAAVAVIDFEIEAWADLLVRAEGTLRGVHRPMRAWEDS